MDRLFNDYAERGASLPPHLDSDPVAVSHHDVAVLFDFGTLIGKRIGTMGGVSYMEFVVPGLIMMAILTNTYANVVGSFFGAKFNNSIEELLVSPTPTYVIVLGYAAGGVSRGILVSIIVTSVALFFTKLDIHSWLVVIGVVMLTSISFSLLGQLTLFSQTPLMTSTSCLPSS